MLGAIAMMYPWVGYAKLRLDYVTGEWGEHKRISVTLFYNWAE